MALIKCSECGKEISDTAKICVNCGNPINTKQFKKSNFNIKRPMVKYLIGISILSLIVVCIIYKVSTSNKQNENKNSFVGVYIGEEYPKSRIEFYDDNTCYFQLESVIFHDANVFYNCTYKYLGDIIRIEYNEDTIENETYDLGDDDKYVDKTRHRTGTFEIIDNNKIYCSIGDCARFEYYIKE